MIKYNVFSKEPYIFYGITHYDPRNGRVLYYFNYVAYNSGYFGFKKPKFKYIHVNYDHTHHNFIFEIFEQPNGNIPSVRSFLKNSECLIKYIETERQKLHDSDFCSTIYDYVKTKKDEEELRQRRQEPHRMGGW